MVVQNVKVYRVNRDYYKFNSCENNQSILAEIVNILNIKKPQQETKQLKELPTFNEDGLTYYLIVHKHKEKDSDWQKYFPPVLTHSWDFKLQNLSIILLVNNDIDIFVVIGGAAFQQIVTFIDHTFGLRLLSKIIDPDEDQILSINSRGLTGARSGISEQYRDEIRIADFAKFGKLPTEAHITLSQKTTDTFFDFLKNKPNDRLKIHVGKSFKVKKSLRFEELKRLMQEIGHIMSLEENDYLSSFIQEIDRNVLEENFQPLLINSLFDDLDKVDSNVNKDDLRFKFDFCNSEHMVEFYGADKYVLTEKIDDTYKPFAETENRHAIYSQVLNHAKRVLPNPKLFEFKRYIQGVRILAYQDGKRVCSGSFLYHFTSEFTLGPQTIFLVDNKWYRLKYSFLQDLKTEVISLIHRQSLPGHIFSMSWPQELSEHQYNMQYHKTNQYIVFDTITPQGIELCDVLFIDHDTTYLVHVKKGFDNSMRELTNQILISARRLFTDLKSKEKIYLKDIWSSYIKKYPDDVRFTFEDFLSSFDKKVIFVLGFISKTKDNKDLVSNIDNYKSSIAKYSMIQCSRDMQDYQFGFNICQIQKI